MSVRVVYFAWVRERIGRSMEVIDFPPTVVTVGDALAWLRDRGPEYEAAFARPDVIRAAIDQTHVQHTAPISSARELAFFPPVTGG
jgi:molybdopterin synthase sulfur carrier subunit